MDNKLPENINKCLEYMNIEEEDDLLIKLLKDNLKELKKEFISVEDSFYKENKYINDFMSVQNKDKFDFDDTQEKSSELCPYCQTYNNKIFIEQLSAGDETENMFLICNNKDCPKYNVKIKIV